jgi:predicted DNA-binding antitoxin AbrB/MazE fold protein
MRKDTDKEIKLEEGKRSEIPISETADDGIKEVVKFLEWENKTQNERIERLEKTWRNLKV